MQSLAGKAASVKFGLQTGSGRLFQADGPAEAKALRLNRIPYHTMPWLGCLINDLPIGSTAQKTTADLKSLNYTQHFGAKAWSGKGGHVSMTTLLTICQC